MKSKRDIVVKTYLSPDTFLPFAAECEADGESQSAAIGRMIKNRTAHRNNKHRGVHMEDLNRGRSGPTFGCSAAKLAPGYRSNYRVEMGRMNL